MRKIYEAFGDGKRQIIDNAYMAFQKQIFTHDLIGANDFIMVGRTYNVPKNLKIDIKWTLNGLIEDDKELGDIIIIEPFEEHFEDENILNVNSVNTCFKEPIELSSRAIILMPVEKYKNLCNDTEIEKVLKQTNLRLYEGEEELAVKMIFFDKKYIYLNLTKEGYSLNDDNHIYAKEYTKTIIEKQKEIDERIKAGEKESGIKKEKKRIVRLRKNYKKK